MIRPSQATLRVAFLFSLAVFSIVAGWADAMAAGLTCRQIFLPKGALNANEVVQELVLMRTEIDQARKDENHQLATLLYREYQVAYRSAVAHGLDLSAIQQRVKEKIEKKESQEESRIEETIARERQNIVPWMAWTPGLVIETGARVKATEAVFSPDGRLVVSGFQNHRHSSLAKDEVRIQDVETGNVLSTFEGETFALSPDATKILVVHAPAQWSMYDVATGTKLYDVPANLLGMGTSQPYFTKDGRALIYSLARKGYVLDARNGKLANHFDGRIEGISPDARYAVVRDNGDALGSILIKELSSEAEVFRHRRQNIMDAKVLAFYPDGKHVVFQHTQKVEVIELRTGAVLYELGKRTDHEGGSAVVTPDGEFIYLSADDGRVEVFSADTGAKVGDMQIGHDNIEQMTFSPDGNRLLVTTWGGFHVQIFDAVKVGP